MHAPRRFRRTMLLPLLAAVLLAAPCSLPGAAAPAAPPQAGGSARPLPEKAALYVTAKETNDRISQKDSLPFEPLGQPEEHTPVILLDRDREFQTIVGIGGALTDASAETYDRLPPEKQQEVLTALFDRTKGNGSLSDVPTFTAAISPVRAIPTMIRRAIRRSPAFRSRPT